tara:strand:- start:314 stop:973 length:660 start_codon:yes stop_codon:yes gene_type:complete
MNLLLINGPSRCGKDTLADMICENTDGSQIVSMADPLKRATHRLYEAFNRQRALGYPADFFETCKDDPNDFFFGLSPRQAYIAVSEIYAKTMHGQSFFGEIFAKEVQEAPKNARLIICSDAGFMDEALPPVELVGIENVTVVHLSRKGCRFPNAGQTWRETLAYCIRRALPFFHYMKEIRDSRQHVEIDGARTLEISNDCTLAELDEKAQWIARVCDPR